MGVSGGLGDVRSDLFRPVAKVFFAVDWRNLQGERLIDMPRTEDERGSTLQLWMPRVHLTVYLNRQRAGGLLSLSSLPDNQVTRARSSHTLRNTGKGKLSTSLSLRP